MYYHPEEEEVLPFFKAIRWIALGSLLFASCLLVDFFLPEQCKEEVVTKRVYLKESNRFGGNTYELKLFTPRFEIQVNPDLFRDAPEKTPIKVYHSPLFNTIKKVGGIKSPGGEKFLHETELPVYRGFAAFPIALLLLSFFTLIYKKDEVISYGAGIITIIILVTILMIF